MTFCTVKFINLPNPKDSLVHPAIIKNVSATTTNLKVSTFMLTLKGQSHKMVVEMKSIEQYFRPKRMVANPFFSLKLGRLKATARNTSANARSGKFCYNSALAYHDVMAVICQWPHNHCANCQSRGKWTKDFWQFMQKTRWQVLAVRAMVVRPLASRSSQSAMCQGTCPKCHSWGSIDAHS
jgi:hypothetical protein